MSKALKTYSSIQRLADGLTESWLHERFGTPTLRRDIKATIKYILKIDEAASSSTQEQTKKRKICGFCPYKKRKMTKYSCYLCKKPICGEHTVPTCK
ncbi:unnamed protein product [Euphydryas editha]|uniref:PiggyBac transposable element-derived protein 4 C-terminal zinc-ribbon domain-containing protein n=1 Tax=Euphydryas editha TaxID=104508 RepID=A0AAU9V3C5_EUPED|nr:unnamed protein product [Euphydryas editha]